MHTLQKKAVIHWCVSDTQTQAHNLLASNG